MGSDGVEPPESEDSRFTVCPATNYGITTQRIKNAANGSRTHTVSLPADFKSAASAYSAIAAY